MYSSQKTILDIYVNYLLLKLGIGKGSVPGSHRLQRAAPVGAQKEENPMLRSFTRTLAAVLAALAIAGLQPAWAETSPLDINTATAAQLVGLKGVGPAKAQAIIEHRDKNGQFKSVDDLKLVQGIGDKMLEQLRPQVTVQDGASTAAAPHP